MTSSVLTFDELNSLNDGNYNRRSEPYKEYFDKMSISDKQKKLRIAFSEKMEEVILYAMSLMIVMVESDQIDKEYVQNKIIEEYLAIASSMEITIDDYVQDYVKTFASEIVETTLKRTNESYYLSKDRAMVIAECEANTSINYQNYVDAVKSGKKYKTWVDIQDSRERPTHREVGGTTIPIDEPFAVGGGLMNFPHDTSYGCSSSEIVNCRCSVKYS